VPEGPLAPRGWAIECRITSEDPANGFLPATGRLEYLRPPAGAGVRWDAGIEAGNEVTLYYDSLLGKIIVLGSDRADALARMRRALGELVVVGVATNQPFHLRLLDDPDFVAGAIDSQFLDRRADLVAPPEASPDGLPLAVAAALAEEEARGRRKPAVSSDGNGHGSAWLRLSRREAVDRWPGGRAR
jgi:acetyl/propionyl-CoA carboxylase alpha subunit